MWMLPILAYAQNATPEEKAANAAGILTAAEMAALKDGMTETTLAAVKMALAA